VAAASPAPEPPVKVRVSRDSFLLASALFLVIATTNILTPLLPDIRADFGVSIATAGFIVGAYGLARLIVDLPAGFIADRVGHRRMSLLAFGLLVAASCRVPHRGSPSRSFRRSSSAP